MDQARNRSVLGNGNRQMVFSRVDAVDLRPVAAFSAPRSKTAIESDSMTSSVATIDPSTRCTRSGSRRIGNDECVINAAFRQQSGDRRHRLLLLGIGMIDDTAEFSLGVEIDFADTGAGQDFVELVLQRHTPIGFEAPWRRTAEHIAKRRKRLGDDQRTLRLAVQCA